MIGFGRQRDSELSRRVTRLLVNQGLHREEHRRDRAGEGRAWVVQSALRSEVCHA